MIERPAASMSMREEIAMHILAGINANPDISAHITPAAANVDEVRRLYVASAVAQADLLLLELNK